MPPKETSLREDLEASISQVEEAEEEEELDASPGDDDEYDEPPTETDEEESPDDDEGEDQEDEGLEGEEQEDEDAGSTVDLSEVPISYSLEAREAWAQVPEVVRSEVTRREKEMAEAMANTGEYRRTHTELTNLAQSYAPILAAEGVDTPMEAVQGLFQTVAELRLGTPQQKAAKMAALIGHYGIDIPTLDAALAGEPVIDPQVSAIQQMLDQRLQPFQQLLETQSHGTHQAQAQVNQELQDFAKNAEFLNYVREDMADLIEMRSRRGIAMTFAEAYETCCNANPQIAKIISQRAEQAAEKARAKKKAASRSVRSRPGEPGKSPAHSGNSLRADLEEAWREAE